MSSNTNIHNKFSVYAHGNKRISLLPAFVFYSHGQGDLLFPPRNVTLTVEDRQCFDVTILDDNISEYNEDFYFNVALRNGSSHPYYSDTTRIIIYDNEGEYKKKWSTMSYKVHYLC